MADLTPYLSGDAVKDYPNLANFPTICLAAGHLQQRHLRRAGAVPAVPVGALGPPEPARRRRAAATQERRRVQAARPALHAARPEPVGHGRREQRRHGRHQRLADRASSARRTSGRSTTRRANSPRPSRPTSSARRSATRGPVGRGHLPPQRDAVQPGQRAQRLRGAALRVPLRRVPERVGYLLGQRRQCSIRQASRASCRRSRRRTAASRPTGPTAASSATASSSRRRPSASKRCCASSTGWPRRWAARSTCS